MVKTAPTSAGGALVQLAEIASGNFRAHRARTLAKTVVFASCLRETHPQ